MKLSGWWKGSWNDGKRQEKLNREAASKAKPKGLTTRQNRFHPSRPVVARRAKSDEFTKGDIRKMVL
jgi:hypothetical protein